MKIETVKIDQIIEYEGNAKLHPQSQIDDIKKSITMYGFNDPIAIDADNIIIEGHGRVLAAKQLGFDSLPTVRLTHLTEAQKKSYIIAHNKTTMDTDFDFDILKSEFDKLNELMDDVELPGFTDSDIESILDGFDPFNEIEEGFKKTENIYSQKVDIPQYQITGKNPSYSEMYDITKYTELMNDIEKISSSDEEKQFLQFAATRHIVFTYSEIAEHYAHSNEDVQQVMEDSALVIIDLDDAIKNGYVSLNKNIETIMKSSGEKTKGDTDE